MANIENDTRAGRGAAAEIAAPQQTRTQEAYARLAGLARELGPDARLPTFVELRDRLGVSVVTLNRALSLLEAQRVLYRRHGVGIFVSPELDRKTIALVCSPRFFEGPEVSPFWRILVDRAQQHVVSRRHQFSLHFAASDGAESPLFEDFRRVVEERRVHGVLGMGLSADAVRWLTERRVPVAVFANEGPFRVEVDYRAVVRLGVKELAARGCNKVAVWSNHTPRELPARYWERPDDLEEPPHWAPYREALETAGLPFHPSRARDSRRLATGPGGMPPQTFFQQGYEMARAVFGPAGEAEGPEARPDGIVSASELFSQGILVGLERVGLKVGRDVHLASHANEGSPVLQPWADQITLLEVSPARLAQDMIEMLERAMSGEPPASEMRWHRPAVRRPGEARENPADGTAVPSGGAEESGIADGARPSP